MACPVAAAGRRIQELEDLHDNLDRQMPCEDVTKEIYLKSGMEDAAHQIDCLIDYISTVEAESVEGAILQMAIASWLFEDVNENELSDRDREKAKLKFNRLIYSAVRLLRDNPAFDLPAMAVDRFLPYASDPWLSVDRRLQIVESKSA